MAKSDEENETRHDKILKEARERLRKCSCPG
jgi:hypothetical protein